MDPAAAEAVRGELRWELTGRRLDPNDAKSDRRQVLPRCHAEPSDDAAADMKMPGAREVECDRYLVEAVRIGLPATQDLGAVDADSPSRIAADDLQTLVRCRK